MILAFRLSMPGVSSWNGRWSGEGKDYVKVVTLRGKAGETKGQQILNEGSFHYSFGDGWRARVDVEEVGSAGAARLRNKSAGFCGYDWMVDSIVKNGRIEVQK
jgi:hypothetical protein